MLGAVVVPTRFEELDLIKRNFRLWNHDGFLPLVDSDGPRFPLVFLFNNGTATNAEGEVRQTFDDHGMDRFFKGPDFIYLDLHGKDDLYLRDSHSLAGPDGAKAGPNNQFFQGIERCRRYGGFVFYMETDCIPIRNDWLRTVTGVAEHSQGAWVVGSVYRGVELLSRRITRHINGNALYAVGDKSFQDFMPFWRSYAMSLIARGHTALAYDCALESLWTELDESKTAYKHEAMMRQTAHRFRFSDFIQNISAPADDYLGEEDQVERILEQSPATVILHGRKFSRAVDLLLSSGETVTPANLKVTSGKRQPVSAPRPSVLVRAKRRLIQALHVGGDWLEATEFSKLRIDRALGQPRPHLPPTYVSESPPKTKLRFQVRMRTHRVELPAPGSDRDSVLAFSLQKAGSTMLYDILRVICPSAGLTFVSYPDELFLSGVSIASVNVQALFAQKGYCFGGFREFPWFPVPILNSARTILLIRDPRDMLVSLYYSRAYSHVIPQPESELRRSWIRMREKTRATPIDDWVLQNWWGVARLLEGYLAQHFTMRQNVAIHRYEDVIFRKREWVEEIAHWYGWDVSAELVNRAVEMTDVIPATADPTKHIRQVHPNNHKTALRKETQEELGAALGYLLRLFRYET